ncbi:caspase domain-containing protein [Phthorimaea operculella]|nr:caspase domain-containing protein [Phthorimaea operculella]
MEKEHREAIQKSFSSLVEQTDLDLMVSTLFEKGVFSDPMIEPYKDTAKSSRDRKRQLYRDITRRGPHAFNHLLDALMENGYWDIVRELDPRGPLYKTTDLRPGTSNGSAFIRLADKNKKSTGKEQDENMPPIPGNIISPAPKKEPVEIPKPEPDPVPEPPEQNPSEIPQFNVIKSTKFFDDNGGDIKLYHTKGRFRGVLVLFSYMEFQYDIETFRNGAQVDTKNLKYLFTELGFKVLTYVNLSLEDTKKTLEGLKNGICGEGPECVFVVFSSHGHARSGTGDTDIRCSDGHLISYFEIIDYFNNERFPALQGIPKVFIFQICRGSNKDLHAPRHLREPSARRRRPRPRRAPSPRAEASGSAGAAGRSSTSHTEQDGTVYDSDDSIYSDDEGSDKRIYSDIIIANSTVPGYASNRDAVLGSWYIQALCGVFAARAHECHVADLFTLVDETLRKRFRTQTSSVDRWGFNRHLYLHPGLVED